MNKNLVFFAAALLAGCSTLSFATSDGDTEVTLTEKYGTHVDQPVDLSAPKTDFGPIIREKGPVMHARRQPDGALSGKLVFCGAGHGWTFDDNGTVNNGWFLQRPLLYQVVEDYGNVDQMALFAQYAWNAGATVIPTRPIGHQSNEAVVDQDDAGVTYTGTWAQEQSAQPYYSIAPDAERFRWATASETESATARFTPSIPEAGVYPVYTWALSASDRTNQLYRIRHAGGITECRINHRMVGKGWVWLGSYYFQQGENGYVEVSNLKETGDPGTVVIADAIRFGNGMGDVNRGGGVSGFPREVEGSRYWGQISTGTPANEHVYAIPSKPWLDDQDDNVGTPPRLSVHMNNESQGAYTDRVYVGVHSNATSDLGADGLINNNPSQRPPNQEALAELLGREINEDMRQIDNIYFSQYPYDWTNKTTHVIYGSIDYGEIRTEYSENEMAATIAEVAFHGRVEDTYYLRDPLARQYIARALVQGTVRYFNQFGGGPLAMAPDDPQYLSAVFADDGSGDVILTWSPPSQLPSNSPGTPGNVGGDVPTGYTVYTSSNGLDFGDPIDVGNELTYRVAGVPQGEPVYFYVTATNPGGEGFPSNIAGVLRGASNRRVLIVDGFDRIDNENAPEQSVPTRGTIRRAIPRLTNNFSYVVQHGDAIAAADRGFSFESIPNEAVPYNIVDFADYAAVIWYTGTDNARTVTLNGIEQNKLAQYLESGGALMLSGSQVVDDLAEANASSQAFLADYLHADSSLLVASLQINGLNGTNFEGNSFALDDSTNGIYDVAPMYRMTPVGSTAELNFAAGGAAGLVYTDDSRVLFLGFPFEGIVGETDRAEFMDIALTILDPEVDAWFVY